MLYLLFPTVFYESFFLFCCAVGEDGIKGGGAEPTALASTGPPPKGKWELTDPLPSSMGQCREHGL